MEIHRIFNTETELQLVKSACTKSFYLFCREFWSTIRDVPPVWNWHHEYICQKLQETVEDVLEGRPKKHDLIITLPPGTSKSSILSVLLPAYLHLRNPAFRFITSSFDQDLANDFGTLSRKVMDSDLYRKLFYQFKYTPNRIDHYRNQYGGERMMFQTGMSPTGRHADLIIMDDLIDPKSMSKESDIAKTNFYMNAVIRPRVVNIVSTPLILVMQRLHQQDPVAEWLSHKDAKIFHISLPAKLSPDHQPKPKGLRKYYVNGLLDPVRLGEEALAHVQTWMFKHDYEAQYLQNPQPTGGLMFKVAMITCQHVDPLDPVVQVARFWDKAIATTDTACYTAGTKVGRTASGRFVVLDVRRGKWGLADRENMIRSTAMSDGYECQIGIEVEPGSSGMVDSMHTVRNLAGFVVFPEKPHYSKEARARAFAIQVEQGNVFMVPGAWNMPFIDELAGFPHNREKDQVDSCCGAFNLLAQQLYMEVTAF